MAFPVSHDCLSLWLYLYSYWLFLLHGEISQSFDSYGFSVLHGEISWFVLISRFGLLGFKHDVAWFWNDCYCLFWLDLAFIVFPAFSVLLQVRSEVKYLFRLWGVALWWFNHHLFAGLSRRIQPLCMVFGPCICSLVLEAKKLLLQYHIQEKMRIQFTDHTTNSFVTMANDWGCMLIYSGLQKLLWQFG